MKEILTDELLEFFGEEYQRLNIIHSTFADYVEHRMAFRTAQALWRNDMIKSEINWEKVVDKNEK